MRDFPAEQPGQGYGIVGSGRRSGVVVGFGAVLAVIVVLVAVATQAPASRTVTGVSAVRCGIRDEVSVGDTGPDARCVERALVDAGWDVVVDGVFDDSDREAVVVFQVQSGLSPDGRVGPRTAEALGMPFFG
jgi:peptidoglycan hydrolase-like protein with peptidoglycan-binding domain